MVFIGFVYIFCLCFWALRRALDLIAFTRAMPFHTMLLSLLVHTAKTKYTYITYFCCRLILCYDVEADPFSPMSNPQISIL